MKRQKSILSFLQKQPTVPESEKSTTGGAPNRHNFAVSEKKLKQQPINLSSVSEIKISDEIKGTETPPEKEQLSLFPAKSIVTGAVNDNVNRNGHSMFSSIKHKFMKPNSVEKPIDRKSLGGVDSNIKESSLSGFSKMKDVIDVEETASVGNRGYMKNSSSGGDDNIHLSSNKFTYSNGRDKESSVSGFSRTKNVINVEETACQEDRGYMKNSSNGGDNNIHLTSNKYTYSNGRDKGSSVSGFSRMKNVINAEETACEGDRGYIKNSLGGADNNIHLTSNKYSYTNGRDKESLVSSFSRTKNAIKVEETACEGDKGFMKNSSSGGDSNIHLTSNKYSYSNGKDKESSVSVFSRMKKVTDVKEIACEGDRGNPLLLENDSDINGPETPGTRPVVPRLKRVQEDGFNFGSTLTHSFVDNSKRVKFSHHLLAENKKDEAASGMATKFDWLLPSNIRDANGRRPENLLFDKRTLYIPPDVLKKMSPSQKQYWTVKSQYMDILIFFKVGIFYELYELDAEIGHKELDWKITMSGVGKCRQVGIVENAIDDAIEKLLARGYKVGRVEQMETSEQAKSRGGTAVIERKLVSVLSPSILINGNIGPQAVHLLALKEDTSGLADGTTAYGFAFVDCAVLQFWVGSVIDDASCAALGALLMQVSPAEVIFESQGLSKETQKALNKYSLMGSVASQMTAHPATDFVDSSEIRNFIQLKGYFNGSTTAWNRALDGVVHQDVALCALGGLTSHLSRLKLYNALLNGSILPYEVYKGCLRMDGQTMVNLEIFSNNVDGGTSGTLYKYLDNCITSSGKRLLRKWLCHPLKDLEQINQRLNVVEELMGRIEIMALIAQYLRKVPDLERFLGQIKATFQSSALLILPLIGNKILKQQVKAFGSLVKGLRVGMNLLMLLQKEDSVFSLILKIFTLPTLSGSDDLDKFLTQFEAAVDSDFPNYQAHELKDSDAEILSILIELFMEKANDWFQVILALNCIDVLRSFATTANFSCMTMSRPVIIPRSNLGSMGPTLHMKGLCHPYALGESGGTPVPNDLCLGDNEFGYNPRTLLLTGPNMGGKSTLLRATCLAVVLVQLGCYVPCESCILSPVDIIFTRLGATDRIMTGESTFLIECTETASVLQNASQDSLVILDELGRGTSTFDGYAIAYAVFRHLVEKVNCRLLFATHYHPLTKEFASHPHVTLQHMACAFKPISNNSQSTNQQLVFLYRLTNGACPESYGMQVALMAGIPKKVVEASAKAGEAMKTKIGVSFRSSERRSEFSTLHEEWLKTLITVSKVDEDKLENGEEDDVFDTLFCLWHELKCSKEKLR